MWSVGSTTSVPRSSSNWWGRLSYVSSLTSSSHAVCLWLALARLLLWSIICSYYNPGVGSLCRSSTDRGTGSTSCWVQSFRLRCCSLAIVPSSSKSSPRSVFATSPPRMTRAAARLNTSLVFTFIVYVSTSDWQLWRIDPSTTPLRPAYSRVSTAFLTWHPDDGCGLLPHIVWTFRRFVSLQSAGGRFRFLVPPSGTTCLSTSHLRRHSRVSDIERLCFPVPTKTLSYDSCVTITIHHYCLDTFGPCNS